MEALTTGEGRFVYLCEDSTEGIFTAVYEAFADGHGHANTFIQIANAPYTREFFTTYITVDTDLEKASKVAHTMQKKISWQVYDTLQMASLSYMPEKADAIYRTIILALQMGPQVLDYLTDSNVALLFKMERNIHNEILHEQGICVLRNSLQAFYLPESTRKMPSCPIWQPIFPTVFPKKTG